MRIRVFGHDGESVFPFGSNGPWYEFQETIKRLGHEIASEDLGEEVDAVIANRHTREISEYLKDMKIKKSKSALVVWEPYVVDQVRYRRSTLDQYGKIYAPSSIWSKEIDGIAFKWPQDIINDESVFDNWNSRLNQAVMIQGNKFSAVKGEMYTLRREVLKNSNIDFYGTNWNKGMGFDWFHWSSSAVNTKLSELKISSLKGMGRKYSNYRGFIEDKNTEFKKYKIAIVIENSLDFISEKLFDAIRSGCLVIYVGPPISDFEINSKNLATPSPNAKEIIAKLQEIISLESEKQEENARKLFEDFVPISRKWENRTVLINLARDILVNFNT